MMKRTRPWIAVTLLAIAFASAASAQHAPPSSEIYLAEITRDAEGGIHVGTPANVTNRKGYDNQPAFSPDGKSLYYVAWGKKGPDIWVMDVAKRTSRLLRETKDWEFSPTPIPGDDAVAVIMMNGPKHELWRYPLNPSAEPTHLLPGLSQAGFFAWSDGEHVLVHELGRHPKLRKVKVGPGEGEILAADIGRTLKRVPGTKDVVFVHRGEDKWTIQRLNAASGEIEVLIDALPKREDFAVSADGTLWTSDGEALFVAPPGAKSWKKVADLSSKIDGISRLEINADDTLLALVGDE